MDILFSCRNHINYFRLKNTKYMNYKLGQSYLLPVKEVITENKKTFYKVEANGKEHNILLFDFQKDDEKPEDIACIVKELREGEPLFVQDTQPLLMRLYKENEVYPFWVKTDCSHLPNPYYEIADWHHFTFKLPAIGIDKLYLHQRIECRVKEIISGRIFFELIKREARTYSLPYLTIEDVLSEVETDVKMIEWFKRQFQKGKIFREIRELYETGNEEWIMMTIELLDRNINTWVTSRKNGNRYLLERFKMVCIYLLEDSDVLLYCSDTERSRYQKMLSDAAQHADIFLEAIDTVKRNEQIRKTDILLTKLKKSGFLYDPDRRLKVLMCLFSLDKELMEAKVLNIFDIIIKGNKDNWMREPFRSAFISMLELFINQSRNKIDRLAAITTEKEHTDLKKLIAALAIQLLLMNEKDNIDRQLIRAMFYRYLTYVKGSKNDVLFEKAFRCLTEVEQSKLEFNWNEISDLTMLAIRTSSILPQTQGKSTFMQSFNGKNSKLQVYEGKIELHQIDTRGKQVAVLPEQMLPWHNIQIYLNGSITPLKEKEISLTVYQRFWKEIEHGVINGTEYTVPKSRKKKVKPEVGDEILIRVKHQDLEEPSHFIFEIEDPTYYGEGKLAIRNIVRYNLLIDERAFCDVDNRPYLIKAKVLSVDQDGNLNFIITDLMNNFVREMTSICDEIVCLVTDVKNSFCLCVSEYGYTVQVPITEDMTDIEAGSYIRVQIDNIRPTGTIEGVFLFKTIESFNVRDAFETLIMNYADDKVYEVSAQVKEEEEQQQEVMMDYEYVAELINIIDRMAVLDNDYIKTYNYLAFARLLTYLVKDSDAAVYYSERMRLIQMLQHFAINGRVEQRKLEELTSNYSMMISNYPMLQSKLYELQLMACMDIPERNDMVWKLMSESNDEHLGRLCKLVLGYNSLKGFGMHNEREAIRKKINEELNIHVDGDEPEYFGEENQTREFKTTTVYPAGNNMRADVKAQTLELMKVICGFLNAEGGTLYLGVNNEGVASGLDNDIEFFGGKDKLDLHIRNNIVQKFGNDANSRIRIRASENNNKYVYALEIQPSQKPIELDGIYYQRQGSSTWPLLGDDLEMFRNRREDEVKRLLEKAETDKDSQEADNASIAVTVGDNTGRNPIIEALEIKGNITPIATSVLRENPVHSWEDNYGADMACFMHFLPNGEYMITQDEYWEDTELSLCIKEEDEYIVLAYDNAKIIRVPVSQIIDKKERVKYKRNKNKVVFACPVKRSELIYTEVKGPNDNNYMRVDDVLKIKEGKITDGGERLSVVENDGLVRCEILSSEHKEPLDKIYDLKTTQLGHILNNTWCAKESEYIQNLLNI